MIDDPVLELARRINAVGSPKMVAYVSGGGTEVFPMLLARGNGSATLLAARIPYDPVDFRKAIGHDPGPLVAERAARGLAMAAFRHALTIRGDLAPEEIFGLGATSKLSRGEGEREGRSHEIHAAIQTSRRTSAWSITFPTGLDRALEERINALFLLNLVAGMKVADGSMVPLDHEGFVLDPRSITYRSESGSIALADLLVDRRSWVRLDLPVASKAEDREQGDFAPPSLPRLLLPGSFRPLHAGHLAMARAASSSTGLECGFEMSLFHPEKSPLDFFSIRSRLEAFEGHPTRIYLTNAPTYLDKARLFPGCTFAIGHDTALRIADPRFYGSESARDAMFVELERLEARFLIFGRVDGSGEFRDFQPEEFDHPVSGFLERVATSVPARLFRVDISSTEVRHRSGRDYD